MENPNYYAVIPAEVRYDKKLKANAKLLYGEITALTQKNGECWASNTYFAKLYDVDPSAISKWIKNLEDNGYIDIEYIRGKNMEIEKRLIKLKVLSNINGVLTKNGEGYCQKNKENNTSINKKNKKKDEFQEELKTIIDFYENNIAPITPHVAEDMEKYLQDGAKVDLIIACMEEAVSRNKRFWKYVASTLNNCCNSNITTARQFKISQDEFKSNKNQTIKKEKVEYREIDYENEEDYKKKILEKG